MKKFILCFLFIFLFVDKVQAAPTLLKQFPEYKIEDLNQIQVAPRPDRDPTFLGEKQTWLFKGAAAPYDGVLLSPEAAAFILTEYEALKLRSELALETQRKSDLAKINLEIGSLHLELETQKKIYEIQLEAKDNQLKSYNNITKAVYEDKNSLTNKILIGVGGGGAGILAGLLIGLLAL